MAMATPAVRTLPFPMSRTGYFSSQPKISLQRAMQRSSAQAFAGSL